MSLLRRLADDLRQHHWTGVAIELVIVVAGRAGPPLPFGT